MIAPNKATDEINCRIREITIAGEVSSISSNVLEKLLVLATAFENVYYLFVVSYSCFILSFPDSPSTGIELLMETTWGLK